MAKWKNVGKTAVMVMHKLVYPGEVVEVPEKMLKTLTPAPLPEAGRGGRKAKHAVAAPPTPDLTLDPSEQAEQEGEDGNAEGDGA